MAKLPLVSAIAGFLHKAIQRFIPEYELYMKAEPDPINSYSRSLMSAWYTLSAYFMFLFISTAEKKRKIRGEDRTGKKK